MTQLNQFLNGLNQKRSLRPGVDIIEMNRIFRLSGFALIGASKTGLNLRLNRFHRP
jgi:hypothetical protein